MSKSVDPNDPIFYVYVYLDPRKPGHYVYGEYEFDYEPFYVGKGKNGRMNAHLCECYQNKNGNRSFVNKIKKIQRVTDNDPIILIQKDGLIEQCSHDLEVRMVATIGRKDLKKGPLCNLTDAGEGTSGRIFTEETLHKMSVCKKGKFLTEEHKRSMGKSQKGRKHTEETKRKIGDVHRGKKLTPETLEKMSKSLKGKPAWNKGKPCTEETKRKISISEKGKKLTEESIRKREETKRRNRELTNL
jgi:hypothetical protein